MKFTTFLFCILILWSPKIFADVRVGYPGTFLTFGLELAYTPDSLSIGAETSVVKRWEQFYFDHALWAGGFVAVNHRFFDNKITIHAGPEIGIDYYGIDGGLSFRDGDFGANVRGLVTLGFAAAYGRYIRISAGNEFEVGLLFKIPLVWWQGYYDGTTKSIFGRP